MANEFTDTNITGTLKVNGVDVTIGLTGEDFLARAILGLTASSEDTTPTFIIGGSFVFEITAQSSPDLTVKVSQGAAWVAGVPATAAATTSLSGFAAPATNPRIDIVQVSTSGTVSRKAGTESGSPTAPTADANNIKLGEVYNRVGQTSIKNTDDATNGYITNNGVHG